MPPSQPDQQQRDRRAAAIAAALGVYVASSGAVAGATAAGGGFIALNAWMIRALSRLFLRWGYRRSTVRWVLRVATRVVVSYAPAYTTDLASDVAAASYARAARIYAAWYLEAATARLEAAAALGPGELAAAQAAEERFVQQHLDAQTERQKAAGRVDREAAKPGNVVSGSGDASSGPGEHDASSVDRATPARVILKWRAHPDDRVTPECRAADGAWFYADTPPIIGYPGMPHGGTCRCWPAHAGSLAAVARGRTVDEAVRGIIRRDPDHRPLPVVAEPDEQEIAS